VVTPVTTRRIRRGASTSSRAGFSDSNFRNGDPERWVISSAPIVNSGEAVGFYWPQVGDPNPVSGTPPDLLGRAARLANPGVRRGACGQTSRRTRHQTITFYETNCPEFVTSGSQDGCGDYRPLGGPYCVGAAQCVNASGDLTGTVYGSDRTGGSISWLARDGADHGTLWATTSAGRIFVTHNADTADPATVLWHRIDKRQITEALPERDLRSTPGDTGHAWVTYSGYNAVHGRRPRATCSRFGRTARPQVLASSRT